MHSSDFSLSAFLPPTHAPRVPPFVSVLFLPTKECSFKLQQQQRARHAVWLLFPPSSPLTSRVLFPRSLAALFSPLGDSRRRWTVNGRKQTDLCIMQNALRSTIPDPRIRPSGHRSNYHTYTYTYTCSLSRNRHWPSEKFGVGKTWGKFDSRRCIFYQPMQFDLFRYVLQHRFYLLSSPRRRLLHYETSRTEFK